MTESLKASFIESLGLRLEALLPNRSGYSLDEVELNPQFISTVNLLLCCAKASPNNGNQNFVSEIIEVFVSLIEKLNIDPTTRRLRERDEKSLTSTLAVTKLLSALLRLNWDDTKTPEDFSMNNGVCYDYEIAHNPDCLDLYSCPPPPPLAINVSNYLDVLLSILSGEVNRHALAAIRRVRPETLSNPEYFVATSPEYSHEEMLSHIIAIDRYISIVLRYIAAANPHDYFAFLKRKVFAWSERNELIPTSAMQKYACLLRYLYCTPEITISHLRRTYTAIPFIRSTVWKELFLYYNSLNLQAQCVYRPDFYSKNIYPGSAAEQNCKLLFDFVVTVFDDQSVVAPSLSSWLVLPCVSDFDEFLSKPNKLKQSFNKRIKFLASLIRDARSANDLNCFECLIDIFYLGSRIPYVSGGVREFTARYLDETYTNLQKIRPKLNTDADQKRFSIVLVKFLVSAIVINKEKYVSHFFEVIKEKIDQLDDMRMDTSFCRDVQIYIRVIKELSEPASYSSVFEELMSELAPQLRELVLCLCQQLEDFDSARDLSSLSRSESSLKLASPKTLSPKISYQGSENNTPLEAAVSVSKGLSSGKTTVDSSFDKNNTGDISSIEPNLECVGIWEKILSDLLLVFTAAPQRFFICGTYDTKAPLEEVSSELFMFARHVSSPIGIACKFKSVVGTSILFDSACSLSMTLVRKDTKDLESTETRSCTTALIRIFVIQSTAEACACLSLVDPKFKSCFVFLNRFLQEINLSHNVTNASKMFGNDLIHRNCSSVVQSVEIILLLALCTHDVQFFSVAKIFMKWHILEMNKILQPALPSEENLFKTLGDILSDNLAFTGLVSLHKRIRSILMSARPTISLYRVWVLVYERWLKLVAEIPESGEESLVFRNFTGFLVCTSGCFFADSFAKAHPVEKEIIVSKVSSFFDKAIDLSDSDDLVTRVVIKEALSNEPHPDVFFMIGEKLTKVAASYIEAGVATEKAILYMEQMISITTAMVALSNDGSFTLTVVLPDFSELLVKFIEFVPNSVQQIKLKLRFCKFVHTVESSRSDFGFSGDYKTRNAFAKISLDWLEQALFGKTSSESDLSTYALLDLTSPASANPSIVSSSKTSEIEYLNVELASECSKALVLQLEYLILEVPEGTKEKNIKRSRNLIFSNYFSLFYKILQKHTSTSPSPLMIRSKYKIQTITDHVLKSISNVLQANGEVGMQFVLPLGYHENKKIRSFFLNIFADMLKSRKQHPTDEYLDEMVWMLAECYDVVGAVAFVASPAEHNLLATSLHGVFSYTSKLDVLFLTLLREEVSSISRSSDIFRRNSTLTRLMSIFAKEDGLPYLTVVLKPFIEKIVGRNIVFEVEKFSDAQQTDMFMEYLTLLVDTIVDSMNWVPESFKFVCTEIHTCIQEKFEDTAIIAVGSFMFLRFFCPAIVSPESFFDMPAIDSKVKRSLMQLVKVMQYIANGSLHSLKVPGLQDRSKELNLLNEKVVNFLKQLAVSPSKEKYPFHKITRKPYSSLRHFHKFLCTYCNAIKRRYILKELRSSSNVLSKRIQIWRRLDSCMLKMGGPKPYISLQGTNSYKVVDTSSNMNLSNSMYADFMAKVSAKNIEMAFEGSVVRSAVFNDGTPVIVVNFRYLRDIGYDVPTFVYLIFEAASRVWDNRFYIVNDFTQFFYLGVFGNSYVSILSNYAPPMFFKNCAKVFYFNLPRKKHMYFVDEVAKMRFSRFNKDCQLYFYSQADDPLVINSLCLGETTTLINHDVRAVFKDCKVYDEDKGEFTPVVLKLGRQWVQICFEKFSINYQGTTETTNPIEILLVSDLTKCDISDKTGDPNEFTLSLNRYNYEIVISSPHRQEVLRFLYFSMLRNSKPALEIVDTQNSEDDDSQLYGKLLNIVFHGLLENDEEVRSAASNLFATIGSLFDFDVGIKPSHAHRVEYPVDTTAFVILISSFFAKKLNKISPKLLKAFFSNFEKLSTETRISGIMYISPWIDNVGDIFYLPDGPELVAEIVRQFCRITDQNPNIVPFLNERIWRKLLNETRLTSIIVDEILAYTIENKSDDSSWDSLISVISPSVEICGEIVSRLNKYIRNTQIDDSDIVLQSKLLEITVLVKVCTTLFFNSHVYGSLYLLDVFFFCTLFINNPSLEFGSDLQKLVVNTIQSFSGKPDLTAEQSKLIDSSIEFFSGQRAKMLFGLTSRERATMSDMIQFYNRSTAFESFCDTLQDFISKMGSADDRIRWMTRWSSLSMEIAFSKSYFRKRAVLGVATLARSGISDSTCGRVLKLLGNIMFDDLETFSTCAICYGQLESGLTTDSPYFALIVWAQIAFSLLEIPFTYQATAHCLTNALEKSTNTEAALEVFILQRCHLEPLLSSFEAKMNVKFLPKNLQLHFFFIICKGLTVSHFRHTSITCLKRVLRSKLANFGAETEIFCYAYLFVLYLSTSPTAFEEILNEVGFEDQEFITIGKDRLPKVVETFICQNDHEAMMTMLIVSYIFRSGSDATFSRKFIGFYCHLYTMSRELALSIFHIIEPRLHESMVNSSAVDLVNDLAMIEMALILDVSYSEIRAKKKIKETVEFYQFENFDRIGKFESSSVSSETKSYTLSKMIERILYKGMCSVIDGQRLEKF